MLGGPSPWCVPWIPRRPPGQPQGCDRRHHHSLSLPQALALLTWKYWFSCTRLSLDRILLMVMRLLLIPPRPVGSEDRGRSVSSLVPLFAKTLSFWATSQAEGDGPGTGRGVGGQPPWTLLSPGLAMSLGPGKQGAAASLPLWPESGVAQEACFQGRRAAGQGAGGRSGDILLFQTCLRPAPILF